MPDRLFREVQLEIELAVYFAQRLTNNARAVKERENRDCSGRKTALHSTSFVETRPVLSSLTAYSSET